jgi:prepilin-type N-terminal cleavage/methylation domain-containing protein
MSSHVRRVPIRLGMTLLEVLVTLVMLALLTSVATLAPRAAPHTTDHLRKMLDDSLSAAIAQGRAITIAVRVDDRIVAATVSPDGRVVADTAFHAHFDSTHAR